MYVCALNFIGMLSKAKGQVLRVSAALHMLFSDVGGEGENMADVSKTIRTKAIIAAVDFVNICCQHAAYVAGRDDEIESLTSTVMLNTIIISLYIVNRPNRGLRITQESCKLLPTTPW